MSFKDIFKKSFIQGFTRYDATPENIIVVFFISVIFAVYIFAAYRLLTRKTFYSKSFNIALPALVLITAAVILTIQSSVVISLGMVGALSIVRFRAAIKEPMEIVYLFWAVAAGIVIGAGMLPLAVIGSAIIGVILILFANKKVHENPYLLILNCQDETAEQAAIALVKDAVKKYAVKSKTVNIQGIEFTAEIRMKDGETAFVNRLNEIVGVENATLVSYNGEYMS